MSKKLFGKVFIFLLVVGLLFAVAPTRQALAQTGPTITTVPVAGATVCGTSANTTTTVDIMVAGVSSEIYGYQVELDYDPSQVTINIEAEPSPIVNGGYLPNGGYSVITNDTTTGLLSIGYSLLRPTEPVTAASGKLVTITMTHVGNPGTVALHLGSGTKLTDRDGIAVTPASISGATITRESPVVAIGTTEYCTLGEAVTAAVTGDTLTVLRNFSVSSTTGINKKITLNTNGKTINNTSDWYSMFMVSGAADLTITGGGVLDSPSATTIALMNFYSTGQPKVTLQDATISGQRSVTIQGNTNVGGTDPYPSLFTVAGGSTTNGIYLRGKGAELVVSGGLVTTGDPLVPPIYGSRTPWDEGTKITISGGNVRSLNGVAIYHPQDGDLNITGGWIEGATGIVMKSGNLDISGPSHIYANGYYAAAVDNYFEPVSTGDAILIFGGAGELGYEYAGDITVNIHNSEETGQVTSVQAYAVREFSDSTTATRTSSVKISSGLIQGEAVDRGIVLFTEQLRDRALVDEPNDTLLLTGGFYSGHEVALANPAYYVFPPLETYLTTFYSDGTGNEGYRIREIQAVLNVEKNKTYPSLAAAVLDADGSAVPAQTLQLLMDIDIPSTVTVDKALKLDLNGKVATIPTGGYGLDVTSTAGNLTITDSSAGASGVITGGYNTVWVGGGATFTLDKGSLTGALYGVGVVGTGSTVNVDGGVIDSVYFAITGNGSAGAGGTIIDIDGGAISSDYTAIYVPQAGSVDISAGTISGHTGIEVRSGSLTISGGSITATGQYLPVPGTYSNGSLESGDAIFINTNPDYAGNMIINISGGTFTSATGYAMREYVYDSAGVTKVETLTVTGGTFIGGVDSGEAGAAVTFSTQLTALQLPELALKGGLYNTDPAIFVYSPYRTYDAGGGLFGIQAIPPILNVELGIEYFDLQTAVDAATAGNTLKFQLDYTIPSTVTVDKALKLDLNGKVATYSTIDLSYAITVDGTSAALTVKDTSTEGTGKILVVDADEDGNTDGRGIGVISGSLTLASGTIQAPYAGVYIRPGASMVMDGGTIGGTVDPLYGVAILGTGSSLDINGGTIEATYFAVSGNGTAGFGDTAITIDGGTLISTAAAAIYHPQDGTLDITAGTISGINGIEMKAGDLSISGGTILGTGAYADPVANDNGSVETGDAILLNGRDAYSGDITVNITGGTITSTNAYALRDYKAADQAHKTSLVAISGGEFRGGAGKEAVTFSDETKALAWTDTTGLKITNGLYNIDPAAFVFSPLRTYVTGSGMYGIQAIPPVINTRTNTEYFDLQLAVNEAEPSDTLKFQVDYTIPATVTINKKLTLDLNGKTATIPTGGYGLDVTSTAGNLTITDSSAGASGAITGGYNTVWVGGGATFTLDKGSLTGALYGVGVVGTGSTVNVDGGMIDSVYFAITGNGSAGLGGTIIDIDGGTLSSDYTAIYVPQSGSVDISGGTIIGHTGIEVRSGSLTISGGSITATGQYLPVPGTYSNGSLESGDAIFINTNPDYAGNMIINISGGTFTSATGYAMREYVYDSAGVTEVETLTVTGGTFIGGVDSGEAGAAVTFSDLLVAANTAGTSNLDLLPGGLYNTNPAAFVYVPYGAYLDTTQDPDMYGIRLLPTISGLVTMQGRPTVRAGVPLALNTDVYEAISNDMTEVNYAFIGVELGTYTFTTSQPRYLNIMANISVNDLANMQLPSLRLLGGDVNQDYKISVADASDVGTAWGSTADPNANINFDGVVNIQDLALVGGNFGLDRVSAYPGWSVVPMPVLP